MCAPAKGSWTSRYFRTKASTLYTKGAALMNDGTDNVPATSTAAKCIGIVDQTKLASDATNGRIKVLVPHGDSCTMTIVGVALTSAIEGRDLDFADEFTLGSASTYKPLEVVKVLSAVEAEVALNGRIA